MFFAKPIISFFLIVIGATNIQLVPDRSINLVSMHVEDATQLDSTLSYISTYSYSLFDGSNFKIYSESEVSAFEKVIIDARIFEEGSVDQSKVNIIVKLKGKWYSCISSDDFKFEIEKYDLEKKEIVGNFQFNAINQDFQLLSISKGIFKTKF